MVRPGAPEAPVFKDIRTTCCTVTYQPPSDDGGAPVTGYILQRRTPGPESEWIKINDTPITDLQYTVDGLTPDTQYEFRVAAVNKFEIGVFSLISRRIETVEVPSKPGCPELVEVIGTTVQLQWTAPDNDGGTDITHYQITTFPESDADCITVSTDANKKPLLSYSIRNVLLVNTCYRFAVAAVNRVGRGPWSVATNDILTFAGKLYSSSKNLRGTKWLPWQRRLPSSGATKSALNGCHISKKAYKLQNRQLYSARPSSHETKF